MTFDGKANFSVSTIAVAPSTPIAGLSLAVQPTEGALFPTPPFNAVVCGVDETPLAENAEIIRVTAKTGDVFTIERAQEGSKVRAIGTGDQIFSGDTARSWTDVQTAIEANIPNAQKGIANGVATLDNTAHQTLAQIPNAVVKSTLKALGEVTGTITPNLSEGNVFTATEGTSALTINKPVNWPTGAQAIYGELVVFKNEHGLTVEVSGWLGTAPTFNTGPEAVNTIPFVSWDNGVHWYGVGTEAALVKSLIESQKNLARGSANPAVAPGYTWAINVKDEAYGAKGDGKIITDAEIASTSHELHSVSAAFTTGDVGKTIGISGASTKLGGVLNATISSVAAGVATLSVAATVTVTGAVACYGTDDTAAFQAAANACPSYAYTGSELAQGAGAFVYAPSSIYIIAGEVTWGQRIAFRGDGPGQSILAPMSGKNMMKSPTSSFEKPNQEMVFENFGVRATWMFSATNTYSAGIRPFEMPYQRRLQLHRVTVVDSPATSFPFDFPSEYYTVSECFAINSGRLNNGEEPGGAGFGIGVHDTKNVEPATITNNFALGGKRYGIFIEGQSAGEASGASKTYRFIGNYCANNEFGIGISGSVAPIVIGNTCIGNTEAGISLDEGTLPAGFEPSQAVVTGNICPENGDGIRVQGISEASKTPPGWKTLITDNMCQLNEKHGIAVIANTVAVAGMKISDNILLQNKLSGLRIYYGGATNTAELVQSVITDNMALNNGTAKVSEDYDGIRIELPCVDVTLDDNRCFDRQGSKTQEHGITCTSTFTGGSVRNNDLRGNALTNGTVFKTTPASATTALSGNLGWVHPAPATVTVTASPFTYKAAECPETLYIYGGKPTKINLNGVRITAENTTNLIVPLQSGDEVEIAYTEVPVVKNRKA